MFQFCCIASVNLINYSDYVIAMGIGVPVFNERGMFLRSASGGRTHVDTNETLLCACSFLETVKERSRKFVPIFLLQLQITVADFLC